MPTVRGALKWCATELTQKLDTLLDASGSEELTPTHLWERADIEAQEQFLPKYMEDNKLIAEVLRFCFDRIPQIAKLNGTAIENVVITGTEDIKPKSKNNGYLHFKIVGTEAGQPVRIVVAVVQQTGAVSVGAALKRLINYTTFGCDRSYFLRDRSLTFQQKWEATSHYQKLVAQGGDWVNLQEDCFKPLFALKYIYDNHKQFGLSPDWLDASEDVQNRLSQNPLI
jgi:hypothetical protein